MSESLEIHGRLELTHQNRTIEVTADGKHLRAEIGAVGRNPFALRGMGLNIALLHKLSRELDARKISLVLTRFGAPLIELGAGARGGWLSWLLRLLRLSLTKRH